MKHFRSRFLISPPVPPFRIFEYTLHISVQWCVLRKRTPIRDVVDSAVGDQV